MSYCNRGQNVELIEFLISNLTASDTKKQMIENRLRRTSTAHTGLQVKFNQLPNTVSQICLWLI